MQDVVPTVGFVSVEVAAVTTGGWMRVSLTRPPPNVRCFPEPRSSWCFAAGHFNLVAMCVAVRGGVCPPFACGRVLEFRVPPCCDHDPLSKLSAAQDFVRHQVPAGAVVWGIFLLVGFVSRWSVWVSGVYGDVWLELRGNGL